MYIDALVTNQLLAAYIQYSYQQVEWKYISSDQNLHYLFFASIQIFSLG